jgi:hypothetical protein
MFVRFWITSSTNPEPAVFSLERVKNLRFSRIPGEEWVKDKILLYVKSEKIPTVHYSSDASSSSCVRYAPSSANTATGTLHSYEKQDQEAIDLLQKAGIAYELVDLALLHVTTRLKARVTGLNETPTLILHSRKVKGLENIKRVLQKVEE